MLICHNCAASEKFKHPSSKWDRRRGLGSGVNTSLPPLGPEYDMSYGYGGAMLVASSVLLRWLYYLYIN